MKQTLTFNLTRLAQKMGGDRYEAEVGELKPMVIYIPQKFSRQQKNEDGTGLVAKSIKIILED